MHLISIVGMLLFFSSFFTLIYYMEHWCWNAFCWDVFFLYGLFI